MAMSRTTSVRLNEHFAAFVERETASGRYASAEEVVEAGLALLEERDDELDRLDFGPAPVWTREALEEAIREGEESGIAEDFEFKQLYADLEDEDAAATR
jgi:antitoxin ParD1/3/4